MKSSCSRRRRRSSPSDRKTGLRKSYGSTLSGVSVRAAAPRTAGFGSAASSDCAMQPVDLGLVERLVRIRDLRVVGHGNTGGGGGDGRYWTTKSEKVHLVGDLAADGLVVGAHEFFADDVLRARLLEIGERERGEHVERDIGEPRLGAVEDGPDVGAPRGRDDKTGLEVARPHRAGEVDDDVLELVGGRHAAALAVLAGGFAAVGGVWRLRGHGAAGVGGGRGRDFLLQPGQQHKFDGCPGGRRRSDEGEATGSHAFHAATRRSGGGRVRPPPVLGGGGGRGASALAGHAAKGEGGGLSGRAPRGRISCASG
jgi:hypothetical protein